MGQVLEALVTAGVGVTQFREVQTDLEEAFMTLARSDKEDVEEAEEFEIIEDDDPDAKRRYRA